MPENMHQPIFFPDPSERLCLAFQIIGEKRMQGLPFLNAALRVEAVNFRPWEAFWLGVMLTPWAAYDFIVARDEYVGDYMMCSLFSPVQQFGDHETARLTAQYALEALFKSDAPAKTGESAPTLQERMEAPLSKRDFLRGRFLRGEVK